MIFDFKGVNRARIADKLSKSVHTINHWFSDEEFKEEYRSHLLEWARDAVLEEIADSIRTIKKIRAMYKTDPGPALQAAMNLLKLAGMTADTGSLREGMVSYIVAHLPPNEARAFVKNTFHGYEDVEDAPFRGSLLPTRNTQG